MNEPVHCTLPMPPLTVAVAVPPESSASIDLQSLPPRPGVLIFQDESSETLAVLTAANLRRTASAKLASPDPLAPRSRSVDYRAVTRTIRALSAGSAFEADWACLQWARTLLPGAYQSMLDRWQTWFIHIDPEAEFPQFVKTAHPGRLPAAKGVNLGPFPDKHAAARYIELLQDLFDLCRYHHILVQAPKGTACAYKEMGKCPAPCDGSVSMASYHQQIQAAIAFASTPWSDWQAETESRMHAAAAARDFETAQRLHDLIDRAQPAGKPAFARVARLESLRMLAVCSSERKGFARIFLIRGGWIEPVCDAAADCAREQIEQVLTELRNQLESQAADFSAPAIENLGLVCAHLFRPRAKSPTCEFLRLDQNLTSPRLAQSIRKMSRTTQDAEGPPGENPPITELWMESAETQ